FRGSVTCVTSVSRDQSVTLVTLVTLVTAPAAKRERINHASAPAPCPSAPTTRNRLVANCIRFAPFTASLDDRGHAVRERAADALHGAGITAKLPGDHPHAWPANGIEARTVIAALRKA